MMNDREGVAREGQGYPCCQHDMMMMMMMMMMITRLKGFITETLNIMKIGKKEN